MGAGDYITKFIVLFNESFIVLIKVKVGVNIIRPGINTSGNKIGRAYKSAFMESMVLCGEKDRYSKQD